MISQLEFVRMVDVQSETIEKYIREGKIIPDMSVPINDRRCFNYFKHGTIKLYANKFGWDLVTASNIKDKFMQFVEKMDMSFSYKPVLLKALLDHMDKDGKVRICDIVDYFIDFYESRKAQGLPIEKSTSIYHKGTYTRKDVEHNILANPFKRFADMRFLQRCKDISIIELNPTILKKISQSDKALIVDICDRKLTEYYARR